MPDNAEKINRALFILTVKNPQIAARTKEAGLLHQGSPYLDSKAPDRKAIIHLRDKNSIDMGPSSTGDYGDSQRSRARRVTAVEAQDGDDTVTQCYYSWPRGTIGLHHKAALGFTEKQEVAGSHGVTF
jgi:hypothetical protein